MGRKSVEGQILWVVIKKVINLHSCWYEHRELCLVMSTTLAQSKGEWCKRIRVLRIIC